MIIDNELTPVADWWFEYNDKGCIRFKDHNQIYDFLLKCQATAEILAEAELFYINHVRFTSWMKFDPNTDEQPHKICKKDGGAMFASYIEPSRLADICFKHLDKSDPFVYPLDIKFYGWGIIIDESRNRVKTPSLMRMEMITMAFPTIDILTYSDVWLPYDLYGNPQPGLHQLNAPRLQKALMEVQAVLGIEPVIDDNELADLHDDFTITNRTDVAGDILIYDPRLQRVN